MFKKIVSLTFQPRPLFQFSTKVDPFGGEYLKIPSPNPNRLKSKVAVITGGSSGIGQATAILFAKSGIEGLVLGDVNESGAQETLAQIKEVSNGIVHTIFVKTDLLKSADIKNLMDSAYNRFGKLNILVNNAGIMHADDDNAITTDEKVWDLTMNVNLKGLFFCCKYGIPLLQKSQGGSIINVASFVGLRGAATPQIAYTASKGGVLAFSRELAIIHAKENIRVNSMCPGPLRTKLLMDFLNTEEKKQRRLIHLPMGRFGEAREIAEGIAFLASDESSYITGTDFLVDGGLCAAYVTAE